MFHLQVDVIGPLLLNASLLLVLMTAWSQWLSSAGHWTYWQLRITEKWCWNRSECVQNEAKTTWHRLVSRARSMDSLVHWRAVHISAKQSRNWVTGLASMPIFVCLFVSFFLSLFLSSVFLLWGDTRSLRMPALRPTSQAGPMRNPREGTSVVLRNTIRLTRWCK